MPYLNINEIQMYYEESGSGTPILLLHGGTGAVDGHRGWGRIRPMLVKQHRAIFVEMRGHGRTNNPRRDLSYEQMANDVCAFVGRLGCAPAHIAGIGDGGVTALRIAVTRPELVRCLICVGANFAVDAGVREALQGDTPEAIEGTQPAWLTEMVQLHDTNKWPGYWRLLVTQVNDNALAGPGLSLEDLQRVAAPTLLIAGENDQVATIEQTLTLRHNIRKSEMLIVNHAGRTVQFTHKDIVGPIMMEFLARTGA